MSVIQLEKTIHNYFEQVQESIKDGAKTNQLFDLLDQAEIKTLEEADKTTLQELLFVLLSQVSSAPVSTSLAACDRILLYLKKIPMIFESFNPSPDMLKHLNFKRLMASDQTEIVYDLMTFILRYYSETDYEDFGLGQPLKDKLVKEEKKRVWLTLDHILIKLDTFLEEFKNRNGLTAKALGEIFSYMENLKKSVSEAKNKQKSLEMDPGTNNKSAVDYKSFEDMHGPSRFVEKNELENLKKELDKMKESMIKSSSGPIVDPMRESKNLEEKLLNNLPKSAYMTDGLTAKLASLESKEKENSIKIEALEKLTSKLADEKNYKMGQLEKKVSDDLESFKVFKERVQIEVDLLKERANQVSHLKSSGIGPNVTGEASQLGLPPSGTKAESGLAPGGRSESIDAMMKIHDNFKRETILSINNLKETIGALSKKAGLNDKKINNAEAEDRQVAVVDQKTRVLDDEKMGQIEDRLYEQDLNLKKDLFNQKKELIERIELLNNVIEDIRSRQSKILLFRHEPWTKGRFYFQCFDCQ